MSMKWSDLFIFLKAALFLRTAVLHAADHHGIGVTLLCLVRGMVDDADAIRISVNFLFITPISSGKGSANFSSTRRENSG